MLHTNFDLPVISFLTWNERMACGDDQIYFQRSSNIYRKNYLFNPPIFVSYLYLFRLPAY